MFNSLLVLFYYIIQIISLNDIFKLKLLDHLVSSTFGIIFVNYMINSNFIPLLFNYEVIFAGLHYLTSQEFNENYLYFLFYALYIACFDKLKMPDFVHANIALITSYFFIKLFIDGPTL